MEKKDYEHESKNVDGNSKVKKQVIVLYCKNVKTIRRLVKKLVQAD